MTGRRGGARLTVVVGFAVLVSTAATWVSVQAGAPTGPGPAAAASSSVEVTDPFTQAGQEARASTFGRKHLPSPVIFPDQTIPLRFTHQVHIGQGIGCADCHTTAMNSVRASDSLLPAEETCLDCHDIEDPTGDPPAACTTCHPGFVPEWLPEADRSETHQVKVHPAPVVLPQPNLTFNHKVHVDRGVTCTTCHQGLDGVDLATRDNALPLMETCIGCHDGKEAPNACQTCHLTHPDGRIKTQLGNRTLEPAGWYAGDAHDDQWLKNHRGVASADEAYCANCHTKQECVDCHNGTVKPFKIHPNNWILQHPIAARKNSPDCSSCHQSQSFCVDCHQTSKVVWEAPNRPADSLRYHPEGWVDDDINGEGVRARDHHSFEAQRNIRACAACHTEDTCVSCHSNRGGRQVNPHPPGFVSSGACDRMRAKNDRVCSTCHDTSDPLRLCR